MSFSAACLAAALDRLMPRGATGLVIALSGGVDSSCLLAAATELPGGRRLRALHVDHGLQAAASAFGERCLALCQGLQVPLSIIPVKVAAVPGASVEAAAREARYRALAAGIERGECLLTAHHAEDQAETLLLQALRGAGTKGLASMPACREFGPGWHLRPLLSVRRADLLEFAAQCGIDAVRDPMNGDLRFERAYLRERVWPLIERRWPGAARSLGRSAEHAADAQALLDALADEDLPKLRDGDELAVQSLRRLEPMRRVNALRRWVAQAVGGAPPAARLAEALRQMMDARPDHLPQMHWAGHALRRYRERIFLTASSAPNLQAPLEWNWQSSPVLELGAGLGRLRALRQTGGLSREKAAAGLIVRRRTGGERLKLKMSAATQSVQHLCQAQGILPWMRDALPLIFAGDDLVAIGDLWTHAEWLAASDAPGVGIRWDDGPRIL